MKRRFLLDTQVFLLAAQENGRLSQKVRTILLQTPISTYLSLVSLWEIQIKLGTGKLKLPVSLSAAVQRGVSDMGLEILPLQLEHIYRLASLPFHHSTLDRLLIAQALHEQMVLLTSDKQFDAYGVDRLW